MRDAGTLKIAIAIAMCIILRTLKKYCDKTIWLWDETMYQLKSSKMNV